MNALAWWRSRSRAARFELYTRLSLYANFAVVPILVGVGLTPDPGTGPTWLVLSLIVVHAVVCVLLVRAGVDHYLSKRARPYRLIAACGALTVAGVVAGILAYPDPTPGYPDGPAAFLLLILVLSGTTALSTAVPPWIAFTVGALGCAAWYALSVAQGVPDPLAPTVGLATLIITVVLAYRVTLWMLGVVWELDRSREVRASLAVAEERLRFARDLHDVLGRTLSVVALKSELAAQLAKRGRDQAADEMLAVRQIAQDSLAELRAVVGGYRTADLDVELSGARSLLASAGIGCRVIGDGGGLPAPVQGTLGWVVREGTTNVLRHSEARGCTITLRRSATGAVTLTMDNDGAAGTGRVRFGSGLIGLAERIAGLGGTVVAERQPPDRFRLTVELPVAASVAQESHA
jgi:two-component system, NarL family, sensor histidine kinase DesK